MKVNVGAGHEFSVEIVEKIGVIEKHKTGWSKELNIVAWGETNPKFDIRDWNPTHEKMSRGITLTESELRSLGKLINEYLGD